MARSRKKIVNEVVPFPGISGDIVGGLRRLADLIEEGRYPDIQVVQALVVRHQAAMTCIAWGQCSALEVSGAMSRSLAMDVEVE